MKKLIKLFFALLISSIGFAQGSFGDIQGQLFEDPETDKPAMFAKVWVERGSSRFGTDTDENGRFVINSIPVGTYVVNINYLGDTIAQTVIAHVQVDGVARLGRINFNEDVQVVEGFDVIGHTEPLLNPDFGQTRISSLDIAKSPAKNNVKDLIASRNSNIRVDSEGNMMIRGSRGNDLIYYIDGVKTGEVQNVPSVAIGSVTVYSSAIPAQYGDTSGGVIILETKSYYDLWRAWKLRESAKDF